MHESLWSVSALVFFMVVVAKFLAKKTSTVDVLWLILFGSIFASLGYLPKEDSFLTIIGEWGIVFVMFALGFEEKLDRFLEGLKRTWAIAIFGAIFPFLAGFFVAEFFGYDTTAAIIWGLAMTATSVGLTMVTLHAQGMQKSKATIAIKTTSILDDIFSIIGISIFIPLVFSGGAEVSFSTVFWDILKVILFFGFTVLLGFIAFPEKLPVTVPEQMNFFQRLNMKYDALYRFLGIRKLFLAYQGEFTPLIMITVAMVLGFIAYEFNFHPAIGAYFAGLFLHKDYLLFSKRKELSYRFQQAKYVVDHMAFTIFGPIFFISLGMRFDLFSLKDPWIVIYALILFGVVFLVQMLSAVFPARIFGKYRWYESIMVGFGMLGRAELAFIVVDIAFRQKRIIDDTQFFILILAIFFLNLSVPLLIKWWKPYYFGAKKLRLFGVLLSREENVYRGPLG